MTDRSSDYPAQGLTPAKLLGILTESSSGHMSRWAGLCEDIPERDAHIAGLLVARRLAVAYAEWQVTPASDEAGAVDIASEIGAMFAGIPCWSDRLADLVDAVWTGYSLAEPVWDTSEGQARVAGLAWIHPKRAFWDASGIYGEVDSLRILTEDEPSIGVLPQYGQLICHIPRLRSSWSSRQGLARPSAWLYMLKLYALKDWSTYAEVHGMPIRIGHAKNAENAKALKAAIQSLGSDAAGIVYGEDTIELISPTGTSGNSIFPDYLGYLDAQQSKLLLGHSSAADSTPGQLGATDQGHRVRQDILDGDARALEQTLLRDLASPWIVFNRGVEALRYLHRLRLHVEQRPDQQAMAQTDEILQRIGLPLGLQETAERYGRPIPTADALILRAGGEPVPAAVALPSLQEQTAPGGVPA